MRYFEKQAGERFDKFKQNLKTLGSTDVSQLRQAWKDRKFSGQSSPWEPGVGSKNLTQVLSSESVPTDRILSSESVPTDRILNSENKLSPKKTVHGLNKVRLGMVGAGAAIGAGLGTMVNSENNLTGTLVGAGAGGLGTTIATGGVNNKLLSRGVSLLNKLRGK